MTVPAYTDLYNLPSQITISKYLFHRLNQLGVHTIFGLPGEFNTPLLDSIYKIPQLRWVGNANELNGACAADGYSRLKRLGCLVTTFGVGELSAINGVAGAYAEHVGLLHIVGMPPTSAITKQLLTRHPLGNGDYRTFYRMSNDVVCYATVLDDPECCALEIDKCIQLAWVRQKPVYLGIPVDNVHLAARSSKLDSPLHLEPSTFNNIEVLRVNSEIEDKAIDLILKKVYTCHDPAIVVDACVIRHGLTEETTKFCEMTQFPVFVTPMGKGAVDESLSTFSGVFTGSISSPNVAEIVKFADFVIVIGAILPEFSTSTFHFAFKPKDCIFIFADHVKFKACHYPDLNIKSLLTKLVSRLDPSRIVYTLKVRPTMAIPQPPLEEDHLLRQEWVWNEFSHWFRPGDVIVTDIGTSAFGVNQTKFPPGTKGISQVLWGSSGYSIGACLGALFGIKDMDSDTDHRVILFVGDGAFQISVQEVSTMIRWNLKPYIFVMNNHGYTIDRFIHNTMASSSCNIYDVQLWDFRSLLPVFGATKYEVCKVVTVGDLRQLTSDTKFSWNDRIRLVEIMVPSTDVPQPIIDKWIREQREHDRTSDVESEESNDSNQITPLLQGGSSSEAENTRRRKKRPYSGLID